MGGLFCSHSGGRDSSDAEREQPQVRSWGVDTEPVVAAPQKHCHVGHSPEGSGFQWEKVRLEGQARRGCLGQEWGPRMQGAGASESCSHLCTLLHLPSHLLGLGHILHVLRVPSSPVLLGSRLEPLQGPPDFSPPPTSPQLQPLLVSPTPGPLHRCWPPSSFS